MFDPLSDLQQGGSSSDDDSVAAATVPSSRRNFADDLHSITIHTRQRTFYVDMKESANGKFFKVSEKSRGGQKSTIMFDAEDIDEFIKAFEEMKSKL